MKNLLFFFSILVVNVIFINSSFGQSKSKHKSFSRSNIERNKVLDETYHLWWYKHRWFPEGDTIAYFVDDRNYKGVINYGVDFRLRNFRNFHYFENVSMYFLKVEFESCTYNLKDSIIEIEGFVSGGWDKALKKGKARNHIDIFLGEKKDTITLCYLGNRVNKEAIESKLNNKEIDKFAVLDTFPSFYLKNYSYYRTAPEGRRHFKIKGKITKNSMLAFGAGACYSEIFDLGSMIYDPNKQKSKKAKKETVAYKALIINNELVSEIEKAKLKPKEINYYTYTEKAENYITRNQFAQAKLTYLELDKKYPVMFARDINNAIRCCVLSRDIKTAFMFGEKLGAKGVKLPFFNAKIFNSMRNNTGWKSFCTKYDSIYEASQSKFNFEYRKQLEQLTKEDQDEYGLKIRNDKVLRETTERVTDKLIELLKKESYPSEERIGTYVKNDTILISVPDYNVLIRHAIQQNPKSFSALKELLDQGAKTLEYDEKRISNNTMYYNSCLHIYKGNLYQSKSCPKNDLLIKKIAFKFKNPNYFVIDCGKYVVTEYNKTNPDEKDLYYDEGFNFVMKLTDDWEFYEKN